MILFRGHSRKEHITLLIVDPQNDFHPNDDRSRGGALPVPESEGNAKNIEAMIRKHHEKITEIFVTLDTHKKYHIAHPLFWVKLDDPNVNPEPFTEMVAVKIDEHTRKIKFIEDNKAEKWTANGDQKLGDRDPKLSQEVCMHLCVYECILSSYL